MATTRAQHKTEIITAINSIGLTGVTITATRKLNYDVFPVILVTSENISINQINTHSDINAYTYGIHVLQRINDEQSKIDSKYILIDSIVEQIITKLRSLAVQNTEFWLDSKISVGSLNLGSKLGLDDTIEFQTIEITIEQTVGY